MAFGAASIFTNKAAAVTADRVRGTPATYTNPPKFIAMGVGATGAARTAVKADTALSTEVETRTSGTESVQTTSVTGDTMRVVGTIVMTASRAVDEVMTNDAASAGNIFISATHLVINGSSGDSIQYTVNTQYA